MRRFLILFLLLLTPTRIFAADDTIKIGASLPLSGEVAAYGDDLKNGIDLACADINAKGGVLGKKLQPLFEDDAADPKQSVAIANRFLSEKVAMVTNGVSRTSLAIAPIYAEENIPFLNLASSDATTEHGWKNVVRVLPKNGQEAPKLAALIALHAAAGKLAVLYASEEYSSNLSEKMMKILDETYRIKPGIVQKMSDNVLDFSALVSTLKDQKIDVVFLGFWDKASGEFLRQSAAADYHPLFIGDAVASFDELPKIAGPLSNGVLFTMTPEPQFVPSAKPVIDELAARHIVNRPFAVYGYILGQVYAEAVQKAGSTDGDKVMRALKSKTFQTALGPVTFAANGDMQGMDFDTYMWKDGKIVRVK